MLLSSIINFYISMIGQRFSSVSCDYYSYWCRIIFCRFCHCNQKQIFIYCVSIGIYKTVIYTLYIFFCKIIPLFCTTLCSCVIIIFFLCIILSKKMQLYPFCIGGKSEISRAADLSKEIHITETPKKASFVKTCLDQKLTKHKSRGRNITNQINERLKR